jgi:hypothetical protein
MSFDIPVEKSGHRKQFLAPVDLSMSLFADQRGYYSCSVGDEQRVAALPLPFVISSAVSFRGFLTNHSSLTVFW